jgi:hypothetical protein
MKGTALMDVLVVHIEGDEGFFVNGKLIDVSPADREGTFIADPCREFFANLAEAMGVPLRFHTLHLQADDLEGLGISATDWEWHHLEEAVRDGRMGLPPATRTIEMYVAFPDKSWSDGYYVEIPADTPEARVAEVAGQALACQLEADGVEVAFYGVHWIPPLDAYDGLMAKGDSDDD